MNAPADSFESKIKIVTDILRDRVGPTETGLLIEQADLTSFQLNRLVELGVMQRRTGNDGDFSWLDPKDAPKGWQDKVVEEDTEALPFGIAEVTMFATPAGEAFPTLEEAKVFLTMQKIEEALDKDRLLGNVEGSYITAPDLLTWLDEHRELVTAYYGISNL